MNSIVDELRNHVGDDHKRGCQGRMYLCTCNYDETTEQLLQRAADEITRLHSLSLSATNPADAGKIATALGLLSSCVKSGENWSEHCEIAKNEAFGALARLAALPATPAGAGVDMTTLDAALKAWHTVVDRHDYNEREGMRLALEAALSSETLVAERATQP